MILTCKTLQNSHAACMLTMHLKSQGLTVIMKSLNSSIQMKMGQSWRVNTVHKVTRRHSNRNLNLLHLSPKLQIYRIKADSISIQIWSKQSRPTVLTRNVNKRNFLLVIFAYASKSARVNSVGSSFVHTNKLVFFPQLK